MSDIKDNTQKSSVRPGSSNNTNKILPIIGLVLIGGAIYWGFLQPDPAPEAPAPEPEAQVITPEQVAPAEIVPAQEAPVEAPEPLVEEVLEPVIEEAIESEPVITLADSDALLPPAVEALDLGPMGTTFVQQPNALERGVAIIDNLRNGEVPYKLLPVGRPTTKFPFTDNGLAVTIDPDGFQRYNGLANAVERLDTAQLMEVYATFKAPIAEAWALLGYGETDFETALQNALEAIMLAPDTDLAARLIKKEANWIYEDEALEQLPALQKQLMRMGTSNAEKIKAKARELRGALLDAQP